VLIGIKAEMSRRGEQQPVGAAGGASLGQGSFLLQPASRVLPQQLSRHPLPGLGLLDTQWEVVPE